MKYTKEQVQKASQALAKLPSAQAMAVEIKKTRGYDNLRRSYKDMCPWTARNAVENFLQTRMDEEDFDVCDNARWIDMADKLHTDYSMYTREISQALAEAIILESKNYRLTENFAVPFDVVGTQGVRRVFNSPVPRTFALKYDKYYALATLDKEVDGTIVAGDFTSYGFYDTLKELFFSLNHAHQQGRVLCKADLTQKAERGELSENLVIHRTWFVSQDEVVSTTLEVINEVKEATYSVVRRGYGDWVGISVMKDENVGDTKVYDVIQSGLKFGVANAMAKCIQNPAQDLVTIESYERKLEKLKARIEDETRRLEDLRLRYKDGIQKLDAFYSNNPVPSDVREQVTSIVQPSLQTNEQPTT